MKIRVVDFEVLTKNFQPYIDGYKNIESEKRNMLESIEPDRKEMEAILKRSQMGLIVDDASQKRDVEKFKKTQDKLMRLDIEFKNKLKEMSDELNSNVYDQLSVIISEWANENSIDLITGKMEVVFNKSDIEVTEQIIEIIKQKKLFYSETENM
jgi:Skp family chaperone for outer membrane proteins